MGDTRRGLDRPALVFAGGDPPGDLPRSDGLPDDRARRRRRLRARPRGRARTSRSTSSSATSTPSIPTALAAARGAGRDGRAPPRRQGRHRPRARAARGPRPRRDARSSWSAAHGGRLDHFLANALAARVRRVRRPCTSRRRFGDAAVVVVRDRAELDGRARATSCSLLPVGGPADGVRTEGLRFPLARRDAPPGLDPRREQRVRRARTRESSARPTACSSPSSPNPRKDS